MRVLITGAAGFLGSHLCERLLIDGHDVLGMDNFITGSPQNLAQLAGHPGFSFIRHDVSNFIFVPGRIDAVMHFASPASPNPNSPLGYVNLPIQTMKAGALGTHNSLGVARAHRARFMLASTSEIYGDPLEHPQTENYWGHVNPIGLRSVYDEAKRFAEGREIELIDGAALAGAIRQQAAPTRIEPTLGSIGEEANATPACPICKSPMQLRKASRGASAGKAFWGCSRYPACRGTRPA